MLLTNVHLENQCHLTNNRIFAHDYTSKGKSKECIFNYIFIKSFIYTDVAINEQYWFCKKIKKELDFIFTSIWLNVLI